MKIIDLLNKIANDIDVPPKKIKYDDKIFEYKLWLEPNKYAYVENGKNNTLEEYCCFYDLNDEVEIIEEENKIPEKIEFYEDSDGHYFIDKHCKKIYITCDEVNFMVEFFNQLIDYLKNKGE